MRVMTGAPKTPIVLEISVSDMNADPKLLALYFEQARVYHSSRRNEVLTIAAMAPRHCANAAEKLLREARMWAQDCAIDTARPELWLTTTKLYQALAKRGWSEA